MINLEVSFPHIGAPKSIKREKLNEILNICKKASTKEYKFSFETPMFMVIDE